jgi:hypothetical protein
MPDATVEFEYDQAANTFFVEPRGELRTREEVDRFFEHYVRFLGQLGHNVYMVANVDGLRVHSAVAEYYGDSARAKVMGKLLGYARYANDPQARMLIRTASLKGKLKPNIYDSREQAIEAIEALKREQQLQP